jgi:hypothetical protein
MSPIKKKHKPATPPGSRVSLHACHHLVEGLELLEAVASVLARMPEAMLVDFMMSVPFVRWRPVESSFQRRRKTDV